MRYTVGLLILFVGAVGCGDDTEVQAVPVDPEAYDWNLPSNFPEPRIPESNPMSAAKVELGRYLFYDKRMSGNETFSCGSCHEQRLAFTDGLGQAEGSTGEIHPRGSMGLINMAYTSTYTWANPNLLTLETQALGPMFGENPVELGLSGREDELIARLEADERYPAMFAESFPEVDGEISIDTITKAISAFQRTLISGNSPVDRYLAGDASALSESAQRGMVFFFSEVLDCFHCHGGFNYSDSVDFVGSAFPQIAFHNTGLYNVDGQGGYPAGNQGLLEVTDYATDVGRFRAPTLRNIAVTAPYMHDGSIETLEGVLDHYGSGGRTITEGPHAGVGADNPFKTIFMRGFTLQDRDKASVIAFLEALTDDEFLTNPAHSDPFEQETTEAAPEAAP